MVKEKGEGSKAFPRTHQKSSRLFQSWVAIDARVTGRAAVVVVNNAVLHRAEGALAGYRDAERKRQNIVGGGDAGAVGRPGSVSEIVAALHAGCQHFVNDRCARAVTWSGAQIRQSNWESGIGA